MRRSIITKKTSKADITFGVFFCKRSSFFFQQKLHIMFEQAYWIIYQCANRRKKRSFIMHTRTSDLVEDVKFSSKQKNTIINKDILNELRQFFKICYGDNGQFVASIMENDDNGNVRVYFDQTFSIAKREPKRESTVSLGEALTNCAALDGVNVFLKTGLFYFPKKKRESRYTENTLRSVKLMAIDVDSCPEIYSMASKEDKLAYLQDKYPLLQTLPPTYLLSSGSKGFHALYAFYSDVRDTTGIFNFTNRCLGVLFGADMQRIGQNNQIRMPYSINQKTGNPVEILSKGNPYDFTEFKASVVRLSMNTYMDYDQNVFSANEIGERYEVAPDVYFYGEKYQKFISDYKNNSYNTLKDASPFTQLLWRLMDDGELSVPIYEYILNRYGAPGKAYTDPKSSCKSNKNENVTEYTYKTIDSKNTGCVKKEKTTNEYFGGLKNATQRHRISVLRKDIERWIDENQGFVDGCRHMAIFYLGVCLRLLGYKKGSCERELLWYNNKFANPIHKNEIVNTVKSVYKQSYRLNNISIAHSLGFSDCIINTSTNWYTIDQKIEKERSRQRVYAKQKRESRKFAYKLRKKLNTVADCLMKGMSARETAKAAGYKNPRYIYELVKKYEFMRLANEYGKTGTKETISSNGKILSVKKVVKRTLQLIYHAKKLGRAKATEYIRKYIDTKHCNLQGCIDPVDGHIYLSVFCHRHIDINTALKPCLSTIFSSFQQFCSGSSSEFSPVRNTLKKLIAYTA